MSDGLRVTLTRRVRAIRELFRPDSSKLSVGAALLFVAYAIRYADDEGYAFPGDDELAGALGASERSIRRWRGELTERGWLVEVKRGGGRGAGRASVFLVRTSAETPANLAGVAPGNSGQKRPKLRPNSTAPLYTEQTQEQHQHAAADESLAKALRSAGIHDPQMHRRLAAACPGLTVGVVERIRRSISGARNPEGVLIAKIEREGPQWVEAERKRRDHQAVVARDAEAERQQAERRREELAEAEHRGELLLSQLPDEQRRELHRAVLATLAPSHPAHQNQDKEPGRAMRALMIDEARRRGWVAAG